MSDVTDENGGKSPKAPTLRTPAFVISSRASARAAALKTRPPTKTATARPVRRRVENLVIARVLRKSLGQNRTWRPALAGSRSERFSWLDAAEFRSDRLES